MACCRVRPLSSYLGLACDRRLWRALLSVVVSCSLVWAQVSPAYADSITDAAAAGQAAAVANYPNPATLMQQDAAGNVILNAGTANQVTLAPNQVVPGTGAVSASTLSAAGGSPTARITVGATAQHSLASGSDASSAAYGALLSSYGRTVPNLRTDSLFTTSRQVINNISTNASLFGDCKTTTTYATSSSPVHVPDYQQCDRHMISSVNVSLTHSYSNGVLVSGGGSVAIASCGDGCLNISLGRVGDNYWCPASGCQIYDQAGFINVQNGAAITSAVLVRAKFDDRIRVYLGGSPPNSGLVWQSDGRWFPPLTWAPGVQCDLHTSYDENPSVDVTSILQAGGSIPFNVRVSVGGCGEGYVQLQVHYNTSVLNYDTWASAADTASVLSTLQMGSVCTSSLTCTAMPALDGNGCAPQTVGRVCPSWFTSPTTLAMAAYVNPLCTQVQVASQCNAAAGQMACFIDYQGNQQCYANTGSSADNCVALRTNPACSYVNTQCIETAANGVCTVAVDTYDCGGSVNVAGPTTASQAIACTGPTRCMGTECVSSTLESNGDFGKVAAKLQALEMMAGDGTCPNPSDPTSCTVFPGKGMNCKVAVGGYVNCCAKAVSVNIADYMKMVFNVKSIDSAIMKLAVDSPVRGSWEMIKTPIDATGTVVDSAWQEAQAAFTSAANSVWASVAPNSGALISQPLTYGDLTGVSVPTDVTSPGIISGIAATISNNLAQWTYNLFGEQAANMIFSAAGDATAGIITGGPAIVGGHLVAGGAQIGGGAAMIGTAITWIGAAYAIYSITTTLIRIIYACESSEYTLDTDRQLKECHGLGSYCASNILGLCIERKEGYCCFNSPLARIMNEQIRPQLGISWGTAKAPQCQGLTIAQLGSVDWSRVDLSEWVALLTQSGLQATPSSVTVDSLTGSGNALATGGSRINAIDRATGQLSGLNLPGVMDKATTQLQSTVGPLP